MVVWLFFVVNLFQPNALNQFSISYNAWNVSLLGVNLLLSEKLILRKGGGGRGYGIFSPQEFVYLGYP